MRATVDLQQPLLYFGHAIECPARACPAVARHRVPMPGSLRLAWPSGSSSRGVLLESVNKSIRAQYTAAQRQDRQANPSCVDTPLSALHAVECPTARSGKNEVNTPVAQKDSSFVRAWLSS